VCMCVDSAFCTCTEPCVSVNICVLCVHVLLWCIALGMHHLFCTHPHTNAHIHTLIHTHKKHAYTHTQTYTYAHTELSSYFLRTDMPPASMAFFSRMLQTEVKRVQQALKVSGCG
jgi:hypothetical protein